MAPRRTVSAKNRVAFLEDIIEHLPIGVIVIDRKGRVLMMNQWQEKISRVRREQVLGAYFHEKWERLFQQGIMSDYWKLLEEGVPFQTILHEVYPQFYDHRISAISRGAPLPGGEAFLLLHDVSPEIQRDRRGLESLAQKLEEQSSFLTNLIDSSPNVVITTDENGRIRTVNRTGEQLLEYGREELEGRDIELFFSKPPGGGERWKPGEAAGRFQEVVGRKKSGRTFPARGQTRDIRDKDGRLQAALHLITDLSHEKAMEEKLALSEKLALYSELMAGIAHQLNNPLVGVANFSSLLLEKTGPDDPRRELVETIHEAAQRCRAMLGAMIKSLREPQGDFHPVDLAETLARARADLAPTPGLDSIELSFHLAPDLPLVRGDAIQLAEVFRNLMVNAVQALPRGGRIEVRARRDPEPGYVRVEVEDNGPGIPPELTERVFEPFFSTKRGLGHGLGLSFAYRVVQDHAGRIQARPAQPAGCVFEIVLPAA
ncbi:MAG: ATP-binding protein [Pseudomonadota bacterium]